MNQDAIRLRVVLLLLTFATLVRADAPATGTVAQFYTNPVLNHTFADPTALRAGNGFFYVYATGDPENGPSNIRLAKSRDLVNWEILPDPMPKKPEWAGQKAHFWAPDVTEHNGKYYMYFSSDCRTNEGKCLGLAIADKPEGPFIATPGPLVCGKSFINIDPMAFDDSATGKKYLYWGSGFQPIKVQELTDDRLHLKPGSQPIDLIKINKEDGTYDHLVEGAWTIKRNDYYLFYSGNNCCGTNAHYAVMVARSQSATGPFETLGQATHADQSTILEQKTHWRAPGHNSIVTDDAGQDWIVYHAIDPNRIGRKMPDGSWDTRRIMLIDRIVYQDGWPTIERGEPSVTPQPAPVIRR